MFRNPRERIRANSIPETSLTKEGPNSHVPRKFVSTIVDRIVVIHTPLLMSSPLLLLPDEVLLMVVERADHRDFLSLALSCRRLGALCGELRCAFLARSYALPITPVKKIPPDCQSKLCAYPSEMKCDNQFRFLLNMSCFRFLSIYCGTNGNENWAFHATDASYRHIPLAFQVTRQSGWCLRPDHSADRTIECEWHSSFPSHSQTRYAHRCIRVDGTQGTPDKSLVIDEQKLLVDRFVEFEI